MIGGSTSGSMSRQLVAPSRGELVCLRGRVKLVTDQHDLGPRARNDHLRES